MNSKDLQKLDKLYQLYRFEVLPIENKQLRAYAYSTKYFSNADIIQLSEDISQNVIVKAKADVEALGFAVTVRNYKSIDEAEQSLFDGFFDFDKSVKVLKSNYQDYTKKVSDVILNKYEYIRSNYWEAETNTIKDDDLVDRIFHDFQANGPVLIVLEAAAGFGKTSTSFEVLNKMMAATDMTKIPLFVELSRNRQATIFRYVLGDEIDRKFPGINLSLVYKHIREGRIPVIIDGFDELLKRKEDLSEDLFEDAEPMLETIRELLTDQAKILLTTRRTAIFAGDEFHNWVEKNQGSFCYKRYNISSPAIADWISPVREKQLEKAGLNLKSIANPVLLSYLRNMDEGKFEKSLQDMDTIIEDYINTLLVREQTRQDLIMPVESQKSVLTLIAGYLVDKDITSENRENIEEIIFKEFQFLLFSTIELYPADNRPTIDSLLSKLTMHAFLDRKSDTNKQLGFVNDFIFGTFIGEDLKAKKEQWWINSERYIDYLLTAYASRSAKTKKEIYNHIKDSVLSYVDPRRQLLLDNYLLGGINHNLDAQFIEDLEFRGHFTFDCDIKNSYFSNCTFYSILLDFSKFENTHFINCRFFDCTIDNSKDYSNVGFTNCEADNNMFDIFSEGYEERGLDGITGIDQYERAVLERFWPSGRDRFIPYRRVSTLRMGVGPESIEFIDKAIQDLIHQGFIIQRNGHYSVQLNIAKINEIKKILNRQ